MNVRVEETQREDRSIERSDPISRIGRPKALFILAAGLSFVLSVSLFFTGSQEQGIYVGTVSYTHLTLPTIYSV